MNTKIAQTILSKKYDISQGEIYLTGIQALVKLPLLQAAKDKQNNLKTAGFISGYRGSPLGGYDLALQKAKSYLDESNIKFEPGLNEDLAASMVWGSQQVGVGERSNFDGVFGIWYAKGPGVDRSMDVLKHANAAGTSRFGGVLAIAGDDHAARSSTLPHQSEHMFMGAMIPVLHPAGVQEYLDFGIHGFAMSRYSGCWVGFKAIADTVESGASVIFDVNRVNPIIPSISEFMLPIGGLNIRWPDNRLEQEARLQEYKVYAALAYCRANKLNEIWGAKKKARFGIVASGKAWLDTIQALEDLGISLSECETIGIRLLKLGMSWPLESEIVKEFADGLDEILVVEEKRPIIEYLLKEQLYNFSQDKRPRVIGKFDDKGEWALPHGDWLLPAKGELTPSEIALAIANRIAIFYENEVMVNRVKFLNNKQKSLANYQKIMDRTPHYCSGCPHSRSTKLPEGAKALSGIGCHYMGTWIYPENEFFAQMGGEGVSWSGMQPFSKEQHMFANLGDGTYTHSGILAIRQSVATGANITYKLLFNDAVAMTGGQKAEGNFTPMDIIEQLVAEKVSKIWICAENLENWQDYEERLHILNIKVYEREKLMELQKEAQSVKGCSVLFFDQTCASEKRRRRKKGEIEKISERIIINPAICEGCGECSRVSNCLSVAPLETVFGTKRFIDQHSCNADQSCLSGFCPSMMTVSGDLHETYVNTEYKIDNLVINKPKNEPVLTKEWCVLIAGIGGTGVITVGQTLGMAAHLDGLNVLTLDQTGLAQKGGAVASYLRFSPKEKPLWAARIADGEADLLIAADMATAVNEEMMSKLSKERTYVICNENVLPSSSFLKNPDFKPNHSFLAWQLSQEAKEVAGCKAIDLAIKWFGEEIAANFMLTGFAYQKGWLPLTEKSILKAIELNGVQVALNQRAFKLGRWLAENPMDSKIDAQFGISADVYPPLNYKIKLSELLARQYSELEAYGGEKAKRMHQDFFEKMSKSVLEHEILGVSKYKDELLESLMKTRFKLALVKDEYEVARLHLKYSNDWINTQMKSVKNVNYWLSPEILGQGDKKIKFNARYMNWMFRVLSLGKYLRGGWLDIFGYNESRRQEYKDVVDFEEAVCNWFGRVSLSKVELLIKLINNRAKIRGFGHIKEKNRIMVQNEEKQLLKLLNGE